MKKTIIVGVVGLTLVMSGCGSDEKKVVEKAKENFRVVYDYEEDKIRPVIEEDMSERELAEQYLLTRLDLEEEEPTFKERGVMEDQGIFIESAIRDGGSVPNISAMDKETQESLSGDSTDRSLDKKEKEFEELYENRKSVLESQYETDNTGIGEVEEEIKRQVTEYEQSKGKDSEEEGKEETEDEGEYEDIEE